MERGNILGQQNDGHLSTEVLDPIVRASVFAHQRRRLRRNHPHMRHEDAVEPLPKCARVRPCRLVTEVRIGWCPKSEASLLFSLPNDCHRHLLRAICIRAHIGRDPVLCTHALRAAKSLLVLARENVRAPREKLVEKAGFVEVFYVLDVVRRNMLPYLRHVTRHFFLCGCSAQWASRRACCALESSCARAVG